MRRKLSLVGDFVAELAAVGEVDPLEPQREVDLVELVRAEAKVLAGRATRAGVGIVVRMGPEEGDPAQRAFARVAAGAAAIVARELMAHAVSASPRDSEVAVTVLARAGGLGSRIVIDDCGGRFRWRRAARFSRSRWSRERSVGPAACRSSWPTRSRRRRERCWS